MRIELNQITLDGLMMEDTLEAEDLDLNTPQIEFISPLKITAFVYRIKNVVSVELSLNSRFHTQCGRCLKDIELPWQQKLKLNYQVEYNQTFIELDQDIREEVIVNYPLRFLCSSECKGLCPKCGKNLNEGLCNCL